MDMRIGVALPAGIPGADPGVIIRWAATADAGPFSHLAIVDRIKYDNFDPFVILSAAAAVTQQVRLATTVLISTLRNTTVVAKQAASLDRLSGGRFVMGLGLGARGDDYQVTGIERSTRGRDLSDQITAMRAVWEGDSIGPRPKSTGGPSILLGGSSGSAFGRMARYADGYIHGGGPPRVFARAVEQARAAWIDLGRPGRPEIWGQGYFALGEEVDKGRDYMRDYYGFTGPFAEKLAAGMLSTPQEITDFAKAYEEGGCDELSLLPAVADLDQLERLGEVIGSLS
jgi:alkanesulfonate monooxygenase SsuD/methylene tetrahydromethanopterin reductase-like flavin-dependent oxidoreductase (luciferase family)